MYLGIRESVKEALKTQINLERVQNMKFTETTEDSYIETQKKIEENEVINEMTEMIKESDFSLSIKKSLEIDQLE